MKFTASLSVLTVLVAMAVSVPVRRDVDPSLVPAFGGPGPNVNPTGTGNCDGAVNGANGLPIEVPCSCPPDEATFLADLNANVAAGFATNNPSVAVSFPTDNSIQSQLTRLETAIVTLQNLNGPGVGCPAASTTFVAQQQALQAQLNGAPPAPPPPPPAAPAPPPPPAPAAAPPPANDAGAIPADATQLSQSQLDSLTPQFDVTPGQDPNGSGSCVGINNILIPCTCPPDRDTFLTDLAANIGAGHATNNPSVDISFPTDGSAASNVARIQAAIVTLQNLNGPGVGCPASSTTFSAQLSAAQAAARRRA